MITLTKSIKRKVTTTGGLALVARIAPEGVYLREPRTRTEYLQPWGHAHQQAIRLRRDAEKPVRVVRVKRGRI